MVLKEYLELIVLFVSEVFSTLASVFFKGYSEDPMGFEIILKYEVDGTLYFLLTFDQYSMYAIENRRQNEAVGKYHIIFHGVQILQEIFLFSLKVSGNC